MRSSWNETFSTGFDWFTIIARLCSGATSTWGGAPAARKKASGETCSSRTPGGHDHQHTRNTPHSSSFLERESQLQRQRIGPGLLAQSGVIILQLQGDGFAGIVA